MGGVGAGGRVERILIRALLDLGGDARLLTTLVRVDGVAAIHHPMTLLVGVVEQRDGGQSVQVGGVRFNCLLVELDPHLGRGLEPRIDVANFDGDDSWTGIVSR